MTSPCRPASRPKVPNLSHNAAGVEDSRVGVEVGQEVGEHHWQLFHVKAFQQGGRFLITETTEFSLSSILKNIYVFIP